ncbi:hypothetical protein FQR65_LT14708 [Abscondita terminalis]|nr:hypothetical protein FQR65_LT14708 [Abscondita terminalis]
MINTFVYRNDSTLSIIPNTNDDNRNRFEVLPQVLAVLLKNILILPIGMSLGYATILIPRIIGNDPNEAFSITEEQVSWIGSSISISAGVATLASGFITHSFGRVRVFIAISVPTFIGWIVYYLSNEIWHIFFAICLNGLCTGLIGAAVSSYVAEICQPHVRGMLSATNPFTVVLGVFVEILLGTFLHWRTAALVSSIIPAIAFCGLWFLPESPHWLLSQNKEGEARKSLAWYRGWAATESIQKEFQNIKEIYQKNQNIIKQTKTLTFKNLYLKKSFLFPLFLVSFLYFLANLTGVLTLQTYGVLIFATLDVPINKYYATLLMGLCELTGSLINIFLVRCLGKRKLSFLSLSTLTLSNLFVGVYAFFNDIKELRLKSDFENVSIDIRGYEFIPLCLLLFLSFSGHCGLKGLPWVMVGEVFSFETRSIGCGFSITSFYISGFLANKTFLQMIHSFTFAGVYWFHMSLGFLGLIVIYLAVPETEGKSLTEIDHHFSGQFKLDNNVRKYNKRQVADASVVKKDIEIT